MGAPTISRNLRMHSDVDPRVKPQVEENMKLTTIALASALALSNTFALANTVRHKPSVRMYHLHRGRAGGSIVNLAKIAQRFPTVRYIDGRVGIRAPRTGAFATRPAAGGVCDVGDNPFIC